MTLVRYMMYWCSAIVFLVMFFLLVAIHIITNRAMVDRVQMELSWQMRSAAKQIVLNDGFPVFSEHFYTPHKEYYYIIVDENGSYINGKFPEDYDVMQQVDIEDSVLTRVDMKKNSFYILDLKELLVEKENMQGNYVLRGIVHVDNVYTVYQKLKVYSFFSVFGAFAALLLFYLVLRKRISNPMQNMCDAAAKISEDLDFSEKIEYDGTFAELDTLLGAYNHLLKRMEEVVRRQEQFNSDVSHELRTPITVIRAQCQLSKERAMRDQNQKAVEAFEVIERQSGKMNQMVELLLNLSRLEQNRMPFEFEEMDLAFVAESVCEDQEYLHGEDYKFVCNLPSTELVADINLITIVVGNLVSNAVKYSPQGSEIHVSCGIREDGMAYLAVKDFGYGIEKENLKKVFESFYRSEEARTSEGFGLGLTLSLKIAKCHRGRIDVKSVYGKGSTFTLLLPVKKTGKN